MVPDTFEPFNSIPAPARPQSIEDMKASPMFVMKVRQDTWYRRSTHPVYNQHTSFLWICTHITVSVGDRTKMSAAVLSGDQLEKRL